MLELLKPVSFLLLCSLGARALAPTGIKWHWLLAVLHLAKRHFDIQSSGVLTENVCADRDPAPIFVLEVKTCYSFV